MVSEDVSDLYYAVTRQQIKPYIKDITKLPISDLKSKVRGQVCLREDHSFAINAKLFNGAMQTPACIIVGPLDAQDISETILFCNTHNLSPSIKSGGYGTHGFSIEGDVIIDMHNMQDISISKENIPLPGSVAAMNLERESDRFTAYPYPDEFTAYPNSLVDPYAPPELLKRRREEAFGSDDEADEASTKVSSSARPSISSTQSASSHERSVAMRRLRSSGSGSGSGSGSSSDKQPEGKTEVDGKPDARRIRQRLGSPDQKPSQEDAILAGGGSVKRPEVVDDIIERSTSGSSSESRSDMTSPPESVGVSTNTPISSDGKEGDVGERALILQDATLPTTSSISDSQPAPAGHSPPPLPRRRVQAPPPPSRTQGPFSYGATSSSSSITSYVPPTTYSPLPATGTADGARSSSYPTHPIEPPAPFVYVSFGAGATQRQVDAYTTANPLSGKTAVGTPIDVPYYVPLAAHPVGTTTMILGGFGFQTRLRGLSVDALVEVEMVLPDGRVVVVNEEENSDLWWAVRGAGPAFGIATRYKAKAFPVPVVFAGNVIYEFNRSTASSLIRHFRDCIKIAPRELYANVILTAGPRQNGALVVIQICWLGPKEGGQPFLNAVLSWSGGQCLLNEVNEKTFARQQDSVAKVLKAAAGRKWFLRSDVVTTLTDDLIHQSVEKFADTPDGCAWLFELGGGAMVDFEETPIPKVIRQATFNIVAFHQWKVEDTEEDCVESAEEWMREHVNKLSAGGPLPSFFERKELVSRTIGMYGEENWGRLVELKRKYDPKGLLKHTFWPLDEDGRPAGLEGSKGKEKEPMDRQYGNHFMDQFLRG